jgi:cytochrome bd-type quinol oxidase subunit 2
MSHEQMFWDLLIAILAGSAMVLGGIAFMFRLLWKDYEKRKLNGDRGKK